jgi:endonuclease-3
MDKHVSNSILKQLDKCYTNVKSDLNFTDIYQLTVAVVLSAQTTDKQVNGVTPQLFKKYTNFKSLGNANIDDVMSIIKSTGFYKTKSQNIIKLGKTVTEKFQGILPKTLEELITLPGIGRKSASVILAIGYDIPAIPVDTHVMRIACRLGYTDKRDPVIAEKALASIIPKKDWKKSHLLFIRHGRDVCKARNPLCKKCSIFDLCNAQDKIS